MNEIQIPTTYITYFPKQNQLETQNCGQETLINFHSIFFSLLSLNFNVSAKLIISHSFKNIYNC